MPYRRTENVARRLAARHAAIIAAARDAASDGGMAAVQIAPVAQRAGIAAGTVYRYFPGKTDLVAALLAEIAEREIGALRRAAAVAPGPLSALAAAIMTFAARALRNRRLTFAAIAEPIDAELDAAGLHFANCSRRICAADRGRRRRAGICRTRMRRSRRLRWWASDRRSDRSARAGRHGPRARRRAIADADRLAGARRRRCARPRAGRADSHQRCRKRFNATSAPASHRAQYAVGHAAEHEFAQAANGRSRPSP